MTRSMNLDQFKHHYLQGDLLILDVRESWEQPQLKGDHILNIPMQQIPYRLDQIPRDVELLVICQHSVRSVNVIRYLESEHGFTNLINLDGGVSTYHGQMME